MVNVVQVVYENLVQKAEIEDVPVLENKTVEDNWSATEVVDVSQNIVDI